MNREISSLLRNDEIIIVKQCLIATVEGPFFPDRDDTLMSC